MRERHAAHEASATAGTPGTSRLAIAWIVCATLVALVASSCGATNGGGSEDSGSKPGGSGSGSGTEEEPASYSDFPDPIVESPAPGDAPELFGDPESGAASGGPCLVEPEPGTLYPRNWLRPRFSWIGGEQNLFELRLRVQNQTNDLVVYTTATSWTMPKGMWDALRQHSADVPMIVSIRGGVLSGGALSDVALGSNGPLGIAPTEAPGSIVFWSILADSNDMSQLKGFSVGEEGVVDVLQAKQMPAYGSGGRYCIGCHTGSPDGLFVSVAWEGDAEGFSLDLASVDEASAAGPPPAFVTPLAKSELQKTQRSMSAFSNAHWAPGDHLLITNEYDDLVWIDLEATSEAAVSGVLARTGDPNPGAFGPSWSHDGQHIAYMSGQSSGPWPNDYTGLDVYVIPYNDRAGATGGTALATPLQGASSPNVSEGYPVYSPDDRWIAFTAIADGSDIYDKASAEIGVVPAGGGQAIRLEANVPPECAGQTSPGVTNSWPKWSPEAVSDGGRTFYWIVFSSRRAGGSPKLYIAPMVVDESGNVTTYRALYLWNQEALPDWQLWGNHTPAWESFAIPDVPVPK